MRMIGHENNGRHLGMALVVSKQIGVILAGSAAAAADTMTLISPKQPASVIVIGAAASPAEKYAADEMSTYLEKITGEKVKIVDDSQDNRGDGNVIAIGRSKLTSTVDTSGLGVEQYIIDVQPHMLTIIGGH